MAEISNIETKLADLERTLRNIVAVGYERSTPAKRMNLMLSIAEKKIMDIDHERLKAMSRAYP